MDRTEFLANRRSGIGGSDIAAVVGLSPWRTPLDVYLSKVEAQPDNQTDAMYFGSILEDVVAKEYEKRSAAKVQRVNQLLRHPEHDFAIANIDRAVINPEIAGNVRVKDGKLTTDRILECKTSNAFASAEWGKQGTDEVPEVYLCQCQWYLGVTGTRFADLAVLIGGNDFRIYKIERDDELIADLLTEGAKFWENLKKGIPPDPSTVAEAVRKFPAHVAGKRAIVDVSIFNACKAIAEAEEKIKQLKDEADAKKALVMSAFGDAEEIVFDGKPIATWKTQTRKIHDGKRFEAEYPDLAAQFKTESASRVFRLKKGI